MTLNQLIEQNREWLTERPRKRFTMISDHEGMHFRLFAEETSIGIFVAVESVFDRDVPYVDPAYNGYRHLYNNETAPEAK